MTKESALLNASLVHALMVQSGYFDSVHFIVWNTGLECEVYGHYDPLKVDFSVLKEKFSLPATEVAYCEDREIRKHTNRVFCFTWLWVE